MIIGVTASGNSKEAVFSSRFGRCDYFAVFNSENDEYSFIENTGKEETGGAGVKAAQCMVDQKIDVIITGNLGPNAFMAMKKAEVELIRGVQEENIETQIKRYFRDELSEIRQAKGMKG